MRLGERWEPHSRQMDAPVGHEPVDMGNPGSNCVLAKEETITMANSKHIIESGLQSSQQGPRAHTLAIAEAIRYRSGIRARIVDKGNEGLAAVDEVLAAMLNTPGISPNVRATIHITASLWPTLVSGPNPPGAYYLVARKISEIFQNSQSIVDSIKKLEILKGEPEVRGLLGAVVGLDYAIALLHDGQNTIYHPDSDVHRTAEQDQDVKTIVTTIAVSDAAGAVFGAVAGSAAGGIGAGPGAFVSAVATSSAAAIVVGLGTEIVEDLTGNGETPPEERPKKLKAFGDAIRAQGGALLDDLDPAAAAAGLSPKLMLSEIATTFEGPSGSVVHIPVHITKRKDGRVSLFELAPGETATAGMLYRRRSRLRSEGHARKRHGPPRPGRPFRRADCRCRRRRHAVARVRGAENRLPGRLGHIRERRKRHWPGNRGPR